jgi:hypothetical protein|tara:strand:- start:354 stop:473 length:120 start_codon:yes stop_codon:yes gene_type:complete
MLSKIKADKTRTMLQNNKFDYRLHKQNVQDDVQEELDAV